MASVGVPLLFAVLLKVGGGEMWERAISNRIASLAGNLVMHLITIGFALTVVLIVMAISAAKE